jgi:hypothetical protein
MSMLQVHVHCCMSISMLLVHDNAACASACIIVKVFLEMAWISSWPFFWKAADELTDYKHLLVAFRNLFMVMFPN